MRIMFLGAAHEVTGSCTLINANGKNIIIDCGLEQGPDIFENCECPINPSKIDAVILTHAHIDHSGKIPYLVKNGFSGNIHTTEATRRLCEIMLKDSAHIQEFEAKWRNRKAKRSDDVEYSPLYTQKDVEKTLPLFVGHSYRQQQEIIDGVSVEFFDAGHLLGSASALITIVENGEKREVLFSGDLGNPPRPLIKATETPPKADFVIVESTYGDRTHKERSNTTKQLAKIIEKTISRGGNVVIPSFAVGRTQELLYSIREIKEKGLVKGNFPVYLDSPLAVEATKIYSLKIKEYFNDQALELLSNGVNPISFPNLKLSITDVDSKAINVDKTPKVIISASGMCEAGRIRHHLKHNLWKKENTILFVGYQTEGTLGRRLLDGARSVKLFGEEIAVKAEILRIDGISCHADKDMLIDWLNKTNPKLVFVNHGENYVCDTFSKLVSEKLKVQTSAPYPGDEYSLLDGSVITKAPVKAISKKVKAHKKARAVYNELVLSGEKLLNVIKQSSGRTNKDLARFTNQIKSLLDKYQK